MPYTRRQVRYLLSSGSPLSGEQKNKMKDELHADPALGHNKKGSAAMKKESGNNLRRVEIEVHRDKSGKVTGHTVHHHYMPTKKSKSGAFSDYPEPTAHPFAAGDHGKMIAHLQKHLGMGSADLASAEGGEPGGEGEQQEEVEA